MNKAGYLIVLILILIVSGCNDEERELQKSVLISDPEAPELPLYTEWGYNTFGAYYDRTVFTSNDVDTPVKIIVADGSTSFILYGDRKTATSVAFEPVTLSITLPSVVPDSYSDLLIMHNTSIDLLDPEAGVMLTINGETFEPEILEGQIDFIRAQSLLVDEKPVEVILSGRFHLKFIHNQVAVTISDGRFDLGIGKVNFFKL